MYESTKDEQDGGIHFEYLLHVQTVHKMTQDSERLKKMEWNKKKLNKKKVFHFQFSSYSLFWSSFVTINFNSIWRKTAQESCKTPKKSQDELTKF